MFDNIPAIVQALSKEKSLEPEIVFGILELALAAATRKDHREDIEARVEIDRVTGDYKTFRCWEVLSDDVEMEYPDKQIVLADARKQQPEIEPGEYIEELIPNAGLGRISAQTARQVVQQKVREAERERIYELYSDEIGKMVFGTVKRVERGDAIIEVENTESKNIEAILPRSRAIGKDMLRSGDRVHAILVDVRKESRGPQLILDRVCPELLIELFKLEVPETQERLVQISNAARDPGERAKISVYSEDPRVDPIGACVGIRGTRVQAVSNEIAGERVDIIKWSPNSVQYVVNALAPADVLSIVIDEEKHNMDVVVAESQLSQAIGRGGQNVRLASQLTGWELNIMTRDEAALKAEEEAVEQRDKFMASLKMDENVASVLVQNGYKNLDDVVDASDEDLLKIKELDDNLVKEIKERAQDALLFQEFELYESERQKVPDDSLLSMDGMDEDTAWLLAENGICTISDVSDCSSFDLLEIPGIQMSQEKAEKLIMTARAPLFESLE